MKTLKELYSNLVDGYETKPISVNDIIFMAAYGSDLEVIKKESKRLQRKSEDIFEDFYERWKTRVETEIQKELEEGSSPHTVMKMVPYITKEETQELLGLIDTLLDDAEPDAQALFGMKVRELESNVQNCLQGASEIFKQKFMEFQEAQAKEKKKSRIITPPGMLR